MESGFEQDPPWLGLRLLEALQQQPRSLGPGQVRVGRHRGEGWMLQPGLGDVVETGHRHLRTRLDTSRTKSRQDAESDDVAVADDALW